MRLFIDTNVLLDIIMKRDGYSVACDLFRRIKSDKSTAFISASSATDLFYIIRKSTRSIGTAYEAMAYIFKLVSVLAVTESDVKTALVKRWDDYEDCVQYVVSVANGVDFIITNNVSDFEACPPHSITPIDYLLSRTENPESHKVPPKGDG